ncbi:hypothetical protein AAVH_31270, partial [Aphelenchoides avenae]
MSVVLQDTDDLVKEVEVFTDGSFKAVQPPTPPTDDIIDVDDFYIPASVTQLNFKTETPLEGYYPVSVVGQDQQDTSFSLAAGDEANGTSVATTESGPSSPGESQLGHDDCSASDASVSLADHSATSAVESDSDGEEETRHAPKHRKNKHNGPFSCAECGRVFYKISNLLHHRRTHRDQKPYPCAHCDKAFNTAKSLRTHEYTHTGVRPYECQQCGMAFSHSSSLVEHKRLHTGVKPYTCSQCGKAFNKSGNLCAHERTHTGEKPYACSHCGRSFVHSNNLRKHERLHTG